jgi:hypothetical protein
VPGVDPRIISKHMLTTPEQVTPAIENMCAELVADPAPIYVDVIPGEDAKVSECFYNVRSRVAKDGGEILYGWKVWEWRRVFVEAEHHAVWVSDGRMVDVTPHIPETKRILFLPDPTKVFDFAAEKRTPNFRRSLGQLPMVPLYFEAFDAMLSYMERNSKGRQLFVDPEQMARLQNRIMQVQASICVALAKDTGPDDPCICASKRKFKNCCAPLIHLNV